MNAIIISPDKIAEDAVELAEIVAAELPNHLQESVEDISRVVIHSDRDGDTNVTEVNWEIPHLCGVETTDPHRVVIYRPDGTAFVHVEAWSDDTGSGHLAQVEIAADGTAGVMHTREF